MSAKVPNSVLVILLGSVGDIARGLAVACAIRKSAPTTKIGWVVSNRFAELISSHPAINEVYIFNEKKFLHELVMLSKRLSAQRYEVCLDLQRIFKSGIISWFSGSSRRIGFNYRNAKEANTIFQTETVPFRDENSVGKLSLYLSFLDAIGVDIPQSLDFGLQGRVLPEDIRLPSQYVLAILSSRWKTKDWPIEGYSSVINSFHKRYSSIPIVVVGTRSDEEKLSLLMSQVEQPELVLSYIGKTSLGQLPAIIERSLLLFGPDSGPLHIASALGVPYVSVFGPTSVMKVHPYHNVENAVVSPLGCVGCYRKICPRLDALCMKLISPQQVFNKICAIIDKTS